MECVSLLRSVLRACGKKLNVVRNAAMYPIRSGDIEDCQWISHFIGSIENSLCIAYLFDKHDKKQIKNIWKLFTGKKPSFAHR